jgi:xylan 1,4-beta-xylosidase
MNHFFHVLPFQALLLIPLAGFAAEPPEVRLIQADLAGEAGPTSRMYNFCVGAGRANEGLRADWQRQLRQVRADCGFRYIRFHGLFCDDMGVYREDHLGRPVYNWQYVDELFDFLQSIGMKPFVELGFMPGDLASGPQTIFWYKANVTPPKDYAKWSDLIAAFARHITERYGRDEVRSWYFEVWNEPNLTGFWMGTTGGKSERDFAPVARDEYFKLYATTARAIKSVDGAYRVGGPATAGSGWIDETLTFVTKKSLPLDFVSTHCYATTSGYLDENGSSGTVFSHDYNAITDEVKGVRAKILASGRSKAELHYTEWSSSYTPFDPIHDSYHSPAFILDKIRHIGAAADSMSYWTFTDIFEEAGPRATPLHGGFGLLNYQDLRKPSYFAFLFLNRLGNVELRNSDPASYVCRGQDGSVQALFWDFTITNPGSSEINQEYYKGDHPAASKGRVHLRLKGLKGRAYQLTATRVGYRSNDLQAAYHDIGSPSQLTKAQVAQLRAASDGAPLFNERVNPEADGSISRQFDLHENDVWLVELRPVQ